MEKNKTFSFEKHDIVLSVKGCHAITCLNKAEINIVAAATMILVWVTYLGALSRINTILIPQISAHPPILAQCKMHNPWALFREGMVLSYTSHA